MPKLEPIAGGAAGVGGTVALRELRDQDGGLLGQTGTVLDRATRPSVVYGAGTGALAAALWYLDNERIMETTPFGVDRSFWATHALTALPSGVASFLFPTSSADGDKDGETKTRTSSRVMRSTETKPAGGSAPKDAGGSGNGEYAEAT